MTLDKLIERLTQAKEKFGGDCEVKLMQGDDELEFTIRGTMAFDDESETGVSVEVVIDVDV